MTLGDEERLVATYAVGLTKIYGLGERPALDGVDVAFGAGELCAVMGPSGAGKSSLLRCLAGHEPPSSGDVFVGRSHSSGVRRSDVGFVLEHSRPLGGCTVHENMRWSATLAGCTLDDQRADRIVAALGLEDDLHTPLHLLDAEQQHLAACAAALVALPPVLVVDEPHGRMSVESFDALRRCTADLGCAIIAVASDPAAAAHADRVLFLSAGRVAGMLAEPTEDAIRRAMDRLVDHAGLIPAPLLRHWAGASVLTAP